MDQRAIFESIKTDFEAVNQTIHDQLASRVPLVEKVADYIISSGGKRLRPALVVLTAKLAGNVTNEHHELATVIEFLHTATLLHDDVVDTSDMRRGKPTANANWGNAPSVLVGDFLYARSFELLVKLGQLPIMDRLANTTKTIAEGEVLQLVNVKNPSISESQYMDVITGKTAILFAASAETSAILSGLNETDTRALHQYGLHLGLAFQLIDDVLDYAGNAQDMGKNVGDDLAEGKVTLPLIHAMANSSDEDKAHLKQAIRKGSLDNLDSVMTIIQRTDSVNYTRTKAVEQSLIAKKALEHFTECEAKTALLSLADIAVERDR